MLDTDTKRRIDTARDILVGKVPDPKSQVEQITIALIYKFMDDMDAESEELGGKRKFFAKEFARYGWANLMHAGLGGFEILNLYAEAIAKMPENPGIPLLFRDIFKNAYLPYRDPETLKMFLKVIDEFNYDHSERLGDAFEYLLSVLGSQGDAGQFRTPRHIIDFMVEVIDPKKTETVLDPACGTAGFLISSYKHILKANTDVKGHSALTPDEKGRLAQNFRGYDISPDMVRLSLVNMYLHGFVDPHIYEYDTLASQDKWNECADVILANPPFMSPKGGIQPHKRFSVQSKRSEVLFVDYMAEHLNPTGRAAIIVPEGIIFTSQSAYKQLRKLLVENYLVAVVSLPAGVFNPYSGVKTSILILDKTLAKRIGTIAFFKVENDGFGLGAQRRAINKNDLPSTAVALEAFRHSCEGTSSPNVSIGDGNPEDFDQDHYHNALVVEKTRIAMNGEYNLSGERYRENGARSSRFPTMHLGDVAEVIAGQSPPGESYNESSTGTPFYQGKTEFGEMFIGPPTKWTTDPQRFAESTDILMSVRAPVGPVNLATQQICIGRGLAAIRPAEGRLLTFYAFYVLRSIENEITGDAGAAFASINRGDIEKIQIPLPPLDVQKEIVAEIEGYQKVIDGARAVLDNYRPHIPIDPDWPEMALGEVCRFVDYRGKTPQKTTSGIPLITAKNVRDGFIDPEPREYIAEADYDSWMTRGIPQVGDVLFTTEAPLGNAAQITSTDRFALAQRLIALCPNRELLIGGFLKDVLLSKRMREIIFARQSGTTVYGIKASVLKEMKIPVPPLAAQQAIVAEIEAEQVLVAANRELIARFEKKIQAALARVWGSSSNPEVD